MKSMWLAIWTYRHFILSSIRVEFRARFARSRLGALWMIIHPLAQAAIYALILSDVMSARLPGVDDKLAYSIYLLGGTLGWSLFSELLVRCTSIFIDNANTMKKVRFPKICLPLITSGVALVNCALLFVATLLIMGIFGRYPGINVLWVVPLVAVTLVLGLGVGLILGTLNVFVRDIGQVVPILLQIMFWFTPIVYSPEILPASIRPLIYLNPMSGIVRGFQNALLFNTVPPWGHILQVAAAACVLLGFALVLFRRASREMADVL
ncbi:ABC transporter permease [Dyella sp. C9]|uniref:ABC transporter permease n=1 Tax=Dyella sp. C9 TaxID=2202154 RepID=UPI000DEFE82F|nr:ABC transporter permease [Dyella sp. C9]